MAIGCGEVIPEVGLNQVLRNAPCLFIVGGDEKHRGSMSLVCRKTAPPESLLIILWHPASDVRQYAKPIKRSNVPLSSRHMVPPYGFPMVCWTSILIS
jgi:hypothetical protein